MSRGYDSPTAALAAIVECLDGLCDRVHVGSLGSGETLPCCPTCLLRVETAGLRVADGLPRALSIAAQNCKPLILDVVINYRECFQVMGASGKSRPITAMTADATALVMSWWEALKTLACCKPLSQFCRFSSIADSAPEGGCAGWTMQLEVDVSMCGCATINPSAGLASPGTVGLGVN